VLVKKRRLNHQVFFLTTKIEKCSFQNFYEKKNYIIMASWDSVMGARFTGLVLGCSVSCLPFLFWSYRLDILTRNEQITHQLHRLLERRFSHHNVQDILDTVEKQVAEIREPRPAFFKFEVPLDPNMIVDRRGRKWDERAPATWGCDPRVSIELHSKRMAYPTKGIDTVMTNIDSARKYLVAVDREVVAMKK
jgi:hypothetical protein